MPHAAGFGSTGRRVSARRRRGLRGPGVLPVGKTDLYADFADVGQRLPGEPVVVQQAVDEVTVVVADQGTVRPQAANVPVSGIPLGVVVALDQADGILHGDFEGLAVGAGLVEPPPRAGPQQRGERDLERHRPVDHLQVGAGEQSLLRRADGATNPHLGGVDALDVALRRSDQRRLGRLHPGTLQDPGLAEVFMELPRVFRAVLQGVLRRDQQRHDAAVGIANLCGETGLVREGSDILTNERQLATRGRQGGPEAFADLAKVEGVEDPVRDGVRGFVLDHVVPRDRPRERRRQAGR